MISYICRFADVKEAMEVKYRPIARLNRVLYKINVINNSSLRGFLPKQVDCLRKAEAHDLLAILPTAYGKSLIFQGLPFLSKLPTKILIASPLNAILLEQKQKLKDGAILISEDFINSLAMSEANEDVVRFRNGSFIYLLGHPETLTCDAFTKELTNISVKFSHLVVDEAHCVLSYGLTEFRPAFLRLKNLKVFMTGCHVVAMTATASCQNSLLIAKELGMKDHVSVRLPPDRSNIYISVKKRPATSGFNTNVENSFDHQLDQLVTELAVSPTTFPKTIVYLPLKWCSYAHKKACIALGIDFHGGDLCDEDGLLQSPVAQYHAPQGSQVHLQLIGLSCPNMLSIFKYIYTYQLLFIWL